VQLLRRYSSAIKLQIQLVIGEKLHYVLLNEKGASKNLYVDFFAQLLFVIFPLCGIFKSQESFPVEMCRTVIDLARNNPVSASVVHQVNYDMYFF